MNDLLDMQLTCNNCGEIEIQSQSDLAHLATTRYHTYRKTGHPLGHQQD